MMISWFDVAEGDWVGFGKTVQAGTLDLFFSSSFFSILENIKLHRCVLFPSWMFCERDYQVWFGLMGCFKIHWATHTAVKFGLDLQVFESYWFASTDSDWKKKKKRLTWTKI
jgi:hypothetical protein